MPHHLPVVQTVKKTHFSFSELSTWLECAFRHKLKYLDKIDLDKPNEHTTFGHVGHAMLEHFLLHREMPPVQNCINELDEEFGKLSPEIQAKLDRAEWHDVLGPIAKELPGFLDNLFKDWEFIGAESQLYESLANHKEKFFKGFIDGVIKVPKTSRLKRAKPGEYEYWILDWKFMHHFWDANKRRDTNRQMQLAFYKHYYSEKLNIPLKDIKTAFVLIRRVLPKNKTEPKHFIHCSLFPISSGEKTIQRALDKMDKMIFSMNKKLYPKNRNSCRFCVYKNSVHCP